MTRYLLLLMLVVVVGVVLGVVFGVALKDDDENTTPSYPTPSPTSAPTVTFSPTSQVTWQRAGTIFASNGAIMSLSPNGNQAAVVDTELRVGASGSFVEVPVVRVYQQLENSNTWSPIGNSIDVDEATTLSLLDNRLAVASPNEDNGVVVYELQDNVWNQVGNTIEIEGWTVALAQEGNLVFVEMANEVQLYELIGNTWETRGDFIAIESDRTNPSSSYSRMAADVNGTSVIVETTPYKYTGNIILEYNLTLESDDTPTTPVSVSGDGNVLAIGQPQADVDGVNSAGKVTLFRFNGTRFLPYGDEIVGDAENGQFGWSHALSGDGKRIAILNNASSGSDFEAVLFGIRGSRWLPILKYPFSSNNATVGISQDGNRVAIGSEGFVALYDIDD